MINNSMKGLGLGIGLVAVALAGCGGSGPSDDPAESAQAFLRALAEGDAETVCTLSGDEEEGPADPEGPEWGQCLAAVNESVAEDGLGAFGIAGSSVPDGLGVYTEAEVTDANVNEEHERANVEREMITGVPDNNLEIELYRFDGKWYVTDVDEETG